MTTNEDSLNKNNIWRHRKNSATSITTKGVSQRSSVKENMGVSMVGRDAGGERVGGLRIQQMFSDFSQNGPFNAIPNNKALLAQNKESRHLPSIKNGYSNNKNYINNYNNLNNYNDNYNHIYKVSSNGTVNKTNIIYYNPTSNSLEKNKSVVYTPEKVIKLFPNQLSDYEKKEILDYSKVYYIGERKDPLQRKSSTSNQNHNSSNTNKTPSTIFTDSQGMYRHNLHDHLAYRYEVVSFLGKGSFGQVLQTFDHKLRKYTAVKMIKNGLKYFKQVLINHYFQHRYPPFTLCLVIPPLSLLLTQPQSM